MFLQVRVRLSPSLGKSTFSHLVKPIMKSPFRNFVHSFHSFMGEFIHSKIVSIHTHISFSQWVHTSSRPVVWGFALVHKTLIVSSYIGFMPRWSLDIVWPCNNHMLSHLNPWVHLKGTCHLFSCDSNEVNPIVSLLWVSWEVCTCGKVK